MASPEVYPALRRIGELVVTPALLAAGLIVFALGNAIGGLALLMAAWFARTTVKARRRQQELERLIDGLTVADVMETVPFVVVPQATLDTFADALGSTDETTVARVMHGEELLGLVGPREVERVPRARWSVVHAVEAMAALETLPALSPGEPLGPAAERLGASAASGLPVVTEGRTAGILTRLAVGRTLHERAEASGARGVRG
jgi:CBS domain-containing protein